MSELTDRTDPSGEGHDVLSGGPATSRRRLAWRVALATGAIGAVSFAALGLASAATSTPAPTPAASAAADQDDDWRGPWAGRRGPGPWGGGPWGGPIDFTKGMHGEVVIAKDGGGTQAVLIQKGAVSRVSATSVTVKSDDGFTKTYAVNADTKVNGGRDNISSVEKDERVLVTAPQTGAALTAQSLIDLTDLGHR